MSSSSYEIGRFRLNPEARVLTHAGVPVALGARGVAVLTVLVSRAGEYVEKAAIMDAAWPGLVVEENNLAAQISAIRRALARAPGGEGWIETLARRGYRFVGPVVEIAGQPEPSVLAVRERTNLPQVLNVFIGRERELAEIKRVLPGIRLLTLTGTGGIGKTRLALQAAAEVLDAYRDGVWFIDLAPLTNPTLVPGTLAHVLGVKESAGESMVSALCRHLQAKEILLVLDNCEHVLNACASLAETLLRETVRVTIITTSLEPLRIDAERTYPLCALRLPDPHADFQSIAHSDAVQLFVERARQHRPDFDLQEKRARAVAEICVRLDGMPLALELAAARIAVLPVEQIVLLLDQRFRLLTSGSRSEPPRHQTLRALIDWSYELLNEAERQLFARLAVFAGGWTLAAAEVVGGEEPIAKDDVLYLLIGLIEKSLVIADADGIRYRMLETIRSYASERLREGTGAEAVKERHRDYYLALVEEAEPKLTSAEQATWLRRLEVEHENLRTGLDWSLLDASGPHGLRLCGALQRFWMMRGHLSEGRAWCRRFLARVGAEEQTQEHAKVLHTAGTLAYVQGDYPAAWALLEKSLAIRRQLGDRKAIANTLNNLGILARQQGDVASTRALHDESLAIRRELGDRFGIATSLNNLGLVAYYQDDYPAARALFEECRAIAQELGDRSVFAYSLNNLGLVAYYQADYLGARVLFEECLAITRELGDRYGIAFSLEGMAAAIAALGGSLLAARIWGAADRLREEIGSPRPPNERPRHDARVAAARANLRDDASFDRAWQEGRALTLEQAIELASEKTVERG